MSPWGWFGGDDVVMSVCCSVEERIYATYVGELVRFAAGLVGPDDAPDVVVEAFVRLSRSRVWGEASNHRALWFRAVVYEAQSWKRSAARRRVREHHAVEVRGLAGEQEEGDDRVEAALEELSAQQRAVVVLTYWLDLDTTAVAALLGVSDGTVRKQLARARRRLRKALQ